jgi:hypothetical protein
MVTEEQKAGLIAHYEDMIERCKSVHDRWEEKKRLKKQPKERKKKW